MMKKSGKRTCGSRLLGDLLQFVAHGLGIGADKNLFTFIVPISSSVATMCEWAPKMIDSDFFFVNKTVTDLPVVNYRRQCRVVGP
jgi:hypothetical protein